MEPLRELGSSVPPPSTLNSNTCRCENVGEYLKRGAIHSQNLPFSSHDCDVRRAPRLQGGPDAGGFNTGEGEREP